MAKMRRCERCKTAKPTDDVRGVTLLLITTGHEPKQGASDTVAFNSFKAGGDLCDSCRWRVTDSVKIVCNGYLVAR
ncbi:hypothetical protein LCGC14_2977810 [marine sediment metagenome]|uniref:Uncharacterized protein n=1 Tax=marine sediment metagenome TaxID=412755 RepID=A0A0F8ZF14_9ZZZZ